MAMAALGTRRITRHPAECERLARALEAERLRLDASRTLDPAIMVAADDGWPPGRSGESIERAIHDIEAAMAVASCPFVSRDST